MIRASFLVMAALVACNLACAQLRPDEITAPVDDNDQRIKELLRQALQLQAETDPSPADLDREIDYFQQILDLKSDHAVAWDGLTKARAQKQALLDKQTEEKRKSGAASTASAQSEQAFVSGDMAGAQKELAVARSLNPGDPGVLRLAQRMSAANLRSRLRRGLGMILGVAFLLVVGLAAWNLIRNPRMPWVEMLDGSGRRFPINAPVIRLGAIPGDGDNKNDIVLADQDNMVSRHHCEFRNNRGRLYLVDCKSANGTVLDGRKIPSERLVPIRDGSRVEVALTYDMRIVLERSKR